MQASQNTALWGSILLRPATPAVLRGTAFPLSGGSAVSQFLI